MWVGGQRHAPAALRPVKTRYPLYRRLGGLQGRSGLVRKISPSAPTGTRSPDRPASSESLYWLSYPAHMFLYPLENICFHLHFDLIYRGADKSLAQPTSRCILFDGENISFDASLVLYI